MASADAPIIIYSNMKNNRNVYHNSNIIIIFYVTGIVDKAQGHTHTYSGRIHIHQ